MSAVTERRADSRAGGVRGLLQPRRETFESVFGIVYRSLMVGVGVGIGALPLAAWVRYGYNSDLVDYYRHGTSYGVRLSIWEY